MISEVIPHLLQIPLRILNPSFSPLIVGVWCVWRRWRRVHLLSGRLISKEMRRGSRRPSRRRRRMGNSSSWHILNSYLPFPPFPTFPSSFSGIMSLSSSFTLIYDMLHPCSLILSEPAIDLDPSWRCLGMGARITFLRFVLLLLSSPPHLSLSLLLPLSPPPSLSLSRPCVRHPLSLTPLARYLPALLGGHRWHSLFQSNWWCHL